MSGIKLATKSINNFNSHDRLNLCLSHSNHVVKSYVIKKSLNPNLIVIEFEYIDTKETLTLEYLIVSMSDIIKTIQNGDELNLDFCYINNFDFSPNTPLILKNFSAKGAFFDGSTNFSNASFKGADISFQYATFNGELVNFYKAEFTSHIIDFRNIQFECSILDFRFSKFQGNSIYFDKSVFNNRDVYFSNALFQSKKVSFNCSVFNNTLRFVDTEFFVQDVNFNNAVFENANIIFSHFYFEGNLEFNNTIFEKSIIDFSKAKFNKSNVSFFNIALLNSKITFQGAHAPESKLLFFQCFFSNHENFRFEEIQTLEILDCTIEKTFLINSSQENTVLIKNLSFDKTRNLGQIYIDLPTAIDSINSYTIESNTHFNNKTLNLHSSKEEQMRMLKENFHNLGEYANEDLTFVEYMRYKSKKTSNPFKKIGHFLINIIGKYGTSPFRVFFTMVSIVMLFGLLFSDMIAFTQIATKYELSQNFNGSVQGLYFSLITFLTIGYGDISPLNNITALLAGIEGFLGLFLMSYFTVAIVRKTLR